MNSQPLDKLLSIRRHKTEEAMAIQDAEWVRHVYDYDPETGVFLWRNPPKKGRGHAVPGKRAGTVDKRDGGLVLSLGGRRVSASRLAWLYVHGEWPDRQVHYRDADLPLPARDRLANLHLVGTQGEMSAEALRAFLAYDAATGEFKWVAKRRGVRPGMSAGSIKLINGKNFKYIRINGVEHSAGRLAWLLTYGDWPPFRLEFRNGDGSDTRLTNLAESRFSHGTRQDDPLTAEEREGRRRETFRRNDLKRTYGIAVDDYAEMLAAQNGVCAICSEPETGILRGRLRHLAVDHDHKTGVVRELLCQKCNSMVENAREQPELLRAAAAYLERHALPDNVLPLKGGK
jgi:hypothetical protein